MENVKVASGKIYQMLGDGVTSNGNGDPIYKDSPFSSFQATVTGTGAVAATVTIQVTNQKDSSGVPVNWFSPTNYAITLSGTTSDSDGFSTEGHPWKWVRAVVSGISGTGATVTCTMGV